MLGSRYQAGMIIYVLDAMPRQQRASDAYNLRCQWKKYLISCSTLVLGMPTVTETGMNNKYGQPPWIPKHTEYQLQLFINSHMLRCTGHIAHLRMSALAFHVSVLIQRIRVDYYRELLREGRWCSASRLLYLTMFCHLLLLIVNWCTHFCRSLQPCNNMLDRTILGSDIFNTWYSILF